MIKIRKITVALVALCVALAAGATKPKYIFYFIGDGMGLGHVMAAQHYNRTTLGNNELLLMMQFPYATSAMTYSASSPITDSAAAGTALSTGYKTNNSMLGMTPDTTAIYSVARYLQQAGYGIGITTSVPIDDATPGAFYAHVPTRKMFTEIGIDMANSGYEFFAGSVLRGDKEGKVTKALQDKGYSIVYGMENYNPQGENGKVLILNPKDVDCLQFSYTIDSVKNALKLPEITKAAIEHLQKVTPTKFFLMVEGGNIDWAAHANDGGAVIKEIINFDQALREAYNFYLQHPDETLIVVTADHDTGGMTIGVSKGPKQFSTNYIDLQRISKEEFSGYCKKLIADGKTVTWDEMKSILSKYFGLYSDIKVSDKQNKRLEEEFNKVFGGKSTEEVKTLYASFSTFVDVVFDTLQHIHGFGWTTTSHTGNMVPVYAIGVGAENFAHIYNNIEIPRRIAEIAGITMK